MKRLYMFIAILSIMLIGCDSYPQTVTVTIPYTVSAVVDSGYVLIWRGDNVVNCPFVDNMEIETLNLSGPGITKHRVVITQTSLTAQLPPSGEKFKVAGFVYDGNLTSLLAVKVENYTLPTRPGKMIIGTVQMNY